MSENNAEALLGTIHWVGILWGRLCRDRRRRQRKAKITQKRKRAIDRIRVHATSNMSGGSTKAMRKFRPLMTVRITVSDLNESILPALLSCREGYAYIRRVEICGAGSSDQLGQRYTKCAKQLRERGVEVHTQHGPFGGSVDDRDSRLLVDIPPLVAVSKEFFHQVHQRCRKEMRDYTRWSYQPVVAFGHTGPVNWFWNLLITMTCVWNWCSGFFSLFWRCEQPGDVVIYKMETDDQSAFPVRVSRVLPWFERTRRVSGSAPRFCCLDLSFTASAKEAFYYCSRRRASLGIGELLFTAFAVLAASFPIGAWSGLSILASHHLYSWRNVESIIPENLAAELEAFGFPYISASNSVGVILMLLISTLATHVSTPSPWKLLMLLSMGFFWPVWVAFQLYLIVWYSPRSGHSSLTADRLRQLMQSRQERTPESGDRTPPAEPRDHEEKSASDDGSNSDTGE